MNRTRLLFALLGMSTVSINAVKGYNPDTDSSSFCYPARLVGDTMHFSGYDWIVKDSKGKTIGPGKNLFSSDDANVRIDSTGRLHLRLTYRDDKWFCPEVHLLHPAGPGTYTFHLEATDQELDKDVVIGFFLYDYSGSDKHHNELDIEISRWGDDNGLNSQYVIQPHVDKAHRFITDLKRPSLHMIEVEKKSVEFRSMYTDAGTSPDKREFFAVRKLKLRKPYQPLADRACINVWLYKATEPTNLREFEIVISKFEFQPPR